MMELHSCNYYCDKAPCIKAQRDEMRDALFDQQPLATLRRKPLSDEQRITELTENGARLVEAADGWKAQAQHFLRERNALEAQLAEANGRIAAYKQDYPMALSRAERADAELALAKSIALDAESEARIANERNHAMSQACDEAHDQFQRAEAENAALRVDAERYRWFRLQSLWDAERFPWPDGFEYPEALQDDGAMLDAAIDAARKT